MDRALVVSLNFNPGHVSHMVASYRQLREMGYESLYCVNEAFVPYLPEGSQICVYGKDGFKNISLAIIVFPSQKNLKLIRLLKQRGSKIVYVFHEPLSPLAEYRKAGFSYKYLAKLWLINQINGLTVKWSDAVLLPSQKAVTFYNANPLYKNTNIHYLPLLYDDERTAEYMNIKRRFFSYIGTVAADHSFGEYLKFVEWAITGNKLPQLDFMVASKSDFEVPKVIEESSRVIIRKGKPFSNNEINECYASTYVVWNAYVRTTQSGVLAKSFMFGTPAIVLQKNLSEFTADGLEVVAIEDNTSCEEIERAILMIMESFESYSDAARRRFEESFYYRQYNEFFKKILSTI